MIIDDVIFLEECVDNCYNKGILRIKYKSYLILLEQKSDSTHTNTYEKVW